MKIRIPSILTFVAILLIVLTGTTHAAELQPLELGWERFFSVSWDAGDRHGRPVVEGYVKNASPYTVGNVRVLVHSLDGAGRVFDQRIAWVPGTLPGSNRLYFEVPVDAAPRYQIRVFSYDRLESALWSPQAP